jgi:hypothetical protein
MAVPNSEVEERQTIMPCNRCDAARRRNHALHATSKILVADKIVMSGKPSLGILKQEILGEMGDLLAGSDILMIIEFR